MTLCRDASVIIIGLDGASPRLVNHWAETNVLPTLGRLMREGASGLLRSTLPPVTAPAWVSFMTGKNPGKHGIFNFRNMDLSRYSGVGPNSSLASPASFQGESIFEIVSAAGGRVASVNVPVTYPPFPVNGVLISGLPLLPDMRRAYTYPPGLAEAIGHWSRDNETLDHLSDRRRLEAADFWLAKHTSVSLDLLRQEHWQLFVTVIRNTDVIPHYLWRYGDPVAPGTAGPEDNGYRWAIQEHYQKADQAVHRLLDAAPEDALVIVMSDHGMGVYPDKYVNLNSWLASQGLLSSRRNGLLSRPFRRGLWAMKAVLPRRYRLLVSRVLPQTAQERVFRSLGHLDQVDWRRTAAYRVPLFPMVDGVEVNLIGRQPQGIVSPGAEYEQVRRSIVGAIKELRCPTGERVVAEAYLREEVYAGPYADKAPDIIVLFNESYTGGPELFGPLVGTRDQSPHQWTATHRMDGIFIAYGPAVRPGSLVAGAGIVDIAPTVLYALGMPVPDDMDGRVLSEIFTEAFRARWEVRKSRVGASARRVQGLSAAEEQKIRAQLRGLGYL
jgi:predicted AlkP superfamily phosphohydrolase/phosphomutase